MDYTTMRQEARPRPVGAHVGDLTACHECGEPTEHVARWDGKVVSLCPACAEKIRQTAR